MVSRTNDDKAWLFLKKWLKLIMGCITTVSFSSIINGVPKGIFHPKRGLGQGCSLSPYLFIIYAETFLNLLTHAERR